MKTLHIHSIVMALHTTETMQTELTITEYNITKYWHTPQPHITKLIWHTNKLNKSVLRNFPNTIELDCCGNELRFLRGIKTLTKLRVLNCSDNYLDSLEGIRDLNLRVLDCSSNHLYDLKGIETSTDLEVLICSKNKLESMCDAQPCTRLRELDCSHNLLYHLRNGNDSLCFPLLSVLNISHVWQYSEPIGLQYCPELIELKCENCLMQLLDVSSCSKLRIIKCGANDITEIRGLNACIDLETLDCRCNKLSSLGIMRSNRLKQLLVSNNRLVSTGFLKHTPDLTTLDCAHNLLTRLDCVEHCTDLININCRNNRLVSLGRIGQCIKLQVFNCMYNQLSSLEGLNQCLNLSKLYCDDNKLKNLEGISQCTNLQELGCGYNKLTSLHGISGLDELVTLRCNHNLIESLDGIRTCTRLTNLNCHENRLTSIEPVAGLTHLTTLYCSYNQITSLEPVVYLCQLRAFYYHDNPIDIQSARFERFIQGLHQRGRKQLSIVYTNSQSVHDEHVQKSVCKSLISLLSDPKPQSTTDELLASISSMGVTKRAMRLLDTYCADKCIHSVHMITYEELLSYVWNRILQSEHKIELVRILLQQVLESENKCFTGRFNRTLSTLVGFSPDIVIEISDASRIGAIILAIRDRIQPYDIAAHVATAAVELQEAGYTTDEIEPWLRAISEP